MRIVSLTASTFVAFLLLTLIGACRSTTSDDSLFVEGDDSTIVLDLESDDPSAVPAFLWSPSQRKGNASFYFLVGEYEELKGNLKEAKRLYEAAYGLDPNPFLAAKLISAQAAIGQLEAAIPEARRMVLLYPQSSQLRRLHGRLLTQKGRYDQAVEEFEQALQLVDTNEEIYLELIDLHMQARRFDRGIILAQELVKAFPASVGGWARMAQLYLAMGDKNKALPPAKTAYQMQPNNPELILIYALTLDMNDQSRQAIALYEQLYRMNPSNQDLMDRMIQMYRQVGDLEEALSLLNELAGMPDGNTAGVQMQQAILLWELDRYAEAAVILEQLSEEFPESERLQYMNGLGQERMQRINQALAAYERIPEGSSLRTQGDFRRVILLRELKKFKDADQLVTKILTRADVSWETYVVAASIKSDLGHNEAAIEVLEAGWSRFPSQIHLQFMKAVYQEKAGLWDECVVTLESVIERDADHSAALNFLGYMYAEKGIHLDEAEKLIRQALALKPNDGYYLDSLGWVYYQKGDYEKALETLLRALEFAPNEGVIFEHLGDTYEALGEVEKAYEYMSRAVESELEDRDAPRIKEKFERMKKRKGRSRS